MLFGRQLFRLAADQNGAGSGPGQSASGADDKTSQPGPANTPPVKAPQDQAGTASQSSAADAFPDDPNELKKLLRHTLDVHAEMKTKFDQRMAAEEKERQKQLAEQGKYKELYEQANAKAELASKYEAVLSKFLETEIAAVPENLRALMPEGDPIAKLDWITKAKASGAFKAPVKKAGDGSLPPGSASADTMTRLAWDQLSPTEKTTFLKAGGKIVD